MRFKSANDERVLVVVVLVVVVVVVVVVQYWVTSSSGVTLVSGPQAGQAAQTEQSECSYVTERGEEHHSHLTTTVPGRERLQSGQARDQTTLSDEQKYNW